MLLARQVIAQTLTESNLPIVLISTQGQAILDDPKIMASLQIIYRGPGQINRITDPPNHYNGKVGIETRGQSSQQFPMKSFGLELWNNSGNSIKRSLLGLPSESDWILYAPYNDKTLMRNALAYHLSRGLGHWASHTIAVEVMLNNEYQGVYWLMEKIKRDAGRVAITKLLDTDNSGEALTGGYIISLDKEADGWFSQVPTSPSGGYPQYSYIFPKKSNITSAQDNYIRQYIDSFEQQLFGPYFQDPQLGWRKFASDSSFADFLLVNELSRNVDGYRLSSYFHKDRNGLLQAGPVWDFDLAFRNANYCRGADTSGWAWQFNETCSTDYWQVPFWWSRLYNDTSFVQLLRCRWNVWRNEGLSNSSLYGFIDSVRQLTSDARLRHFQRWPVLGTYIWPNPSPIATNYNEELDYLKDWLAARIRWIDKHLPQLGPCATAVPSEGVPLAFRILGNPSSTGSLHLQIQSDQPRYLDLHWLSASGAMLSKSRLRVSRGEQTLSIPAPRATGVYLLDVRAGYTRQVLKLLLH